MSTAGDEGRETCLLVQAPGEARRRLGTADLPVALGAGPGTIRLPSAQVDGPRAWIGEADGDLFIQPAAGEILRLAGRVLEASHWLHAGDIVGIGGDRLLVSEADGVLCLDIESVDDANRTLPPLHPQLVPPSAPPPSSSEPASSKPEGVAGVKAVAFRPARLDGTSRSRSRFGLARLVSALVLLVLAATAALLWTARSVGLAVEPRPDRLSVRAEGMLPWIPELGERRLMVAGTYRLAAEKEGYETLSTTFEVGPAARQDFAFTLRELPGRLRLAVSYVVPNGTAPDGTVSDEAASAAPLPVVEATVRSGDQVLGVTGDDGIFTFEGPAGEIELRVEHPRFRPGSTRATLEGRGRTDDVALTLEPAWGQVDVGSRPAGARLEVDGRAVGRTPLRLELAEGNRRLRFTLAGHKPHVAEVTVEAGRLTTPAPPTLSPSDGNVMVTSTPEDARVSVDGVYRGRTPLDLSLAPGRSYEVRVAKAGFEARSGTVDVRSGVASELDLELPQLTGRVVVERFPPDAEIRVDGEPARPDGDGGLTLTAAPHEVEVRRAGFETRRFEVTPVPGLEHRLVAHLESVEAVRERRIRDDLKTVEGHELVLVEPGRLRLGASRREAGRRANEVQREVVLTRRFYLGAQEISNAQFRRFKSDHRSGAVGGANLEIDHHPAVNLTWQEAAAYCNWLSAKQGLPTFYEKKGESWVAKEPMNEGFRLPTEAEWAWVARYDGAGDGPRKYSWGEALPPTEGAGNFADLSAASLLEGTLESYRDGHAATAPVDAFGPDGRGVYQLGGNVAEWVHDVYSPRPAAIGAVERDPVGPPDGELHVIRGASWMHSTLTELRLSFRDYGKDPRPDLGFRIARYVAQETPGQNSGGDDGDPASD